MSSALQSGSSISHYRVISPLGAGGMGEVYLAQDETLGRAVALKVLPRELTKNEERVRRFIQEAKSASSLSHPHIVTIYEIGQAEVRHGEAAEPAADKAPIHFIAMELVSGETLREKIHHEKSDLRTLIRFLAQAAEGLAKAHAAGIIHRDLKPENIMVTKDGYAKVLDFGLAKLTERKEPAADATNAATATREQTREGAVVGTAAYMSPEQVQAKPVDHRSDIFSFGCILYEAAGRTKPFSGDSDVEVMHKILRDKPPPIEELNPEVPAELRRLIRRCMAKAPDQRLQSMKDLALELTEIADEYDELSASAGSRGSGSGSVTPAPGASAPARGSRQVVLAAAVVVGLAAIALGVGVWWRGGGGEPAAPAPFQSMRLTRFTSTGKVQRASISPDGKYLANVVKEAGRHSLWVKQVATGSDVQIVPPLPTPFRGVSFSPDGNYVYYVNQETGGPGYSILYQVPVLGGTPRKLIFDVDTTVAFSPDGKRLAFVRGYPQDLEAALMVANADGTGERKLAVRRDPEGLRLVAPSWSPDGSRIALFVTSPEGGAHFFILMVDAADGRQAPLPGRRWWIVNSLAWVPDGSGLLLTGFGEKGYPPAQIWFAPFPEGEPRRITNDLNDYTDASVTSDGRTVAATQVNEVANLWIAPAGDSAGAKQMTFGSSKDEAIENVNLTTDAVVFTSGKGGRPHIWSMDLAGGHRTQLTPDGTVNVDASVSRDGGIIAFRSLREDGLFHVWRMDRDGGNAVQITHGKGEEVLDVSPDGRWLVYATQGDPALFRMPIEGGAPAKVAETTLGGETAISPDGTRITCDFYVQEGGRSRRAVQVLAADGGKPLATFLWPEGYQLRWAPAGDALTYAREIDGVGNLWSQPLNGGAPRQVTHFSDLQIKSYAWSADGKQIGLSRGQLTSDVVLITDFR